MMIARIAHRYTFIYSAVTAAFLILLAQPITSFYVAEPGELSDLVRLAVFVSAFGTFPATLLQTRSSYLQSTHQIRKSQILTFTMKLFAVVFCVFVCTCLWGSTGAMIAFMVSDFLVCAGIILFYRIRNRNKKGLPTA